MTLRTAVCGIRWSPGAVTIGWAGALGRGAAFGADLSRFKNCMAHRQRMEQRASVQALLAHEEQVKAEFARAA